MAPARAPFVETLRDIAAGAHRLDFPIATLDVPAFERWIRERLPNTPFLVVAESFVGPLAIRRAAHPPATQHGVVLVARFAQLPASPAVTPLQALPTSSSDAFR
jgi:pimeloyl-[acyl-carrier protein] methyl ester esterase